MRYEVMVKLVVGFPYSEPVYFLLKGLFLMKKNYEFLHGKFWMEIVAITLMYIGPFACAV